MNQNRKGVKNARQQNKKMQSLEMKELEMNPSTSDGKVVQQDVKARWPVQYIKQLLNELDAAFYECDADA